MTSRTSTASARRRPAQCSMAASTVSLPMADRPILFSAPVVRAMLDGGGMTWSDEDSDGAPEWWKLAEGSND
jgi:hypothetical protein